MTSPSGPYWARTPPYKLYGLDLVDILHKPTGLTAIDKCPLETSEAVVTHLETLGSITPLLKVSPAILKEILDLREEVTLRRITLLEKTQKTSYEVVLSLKIKTTVRAVNAAEISSMLDSSFKNVDALEYAAMEALDSWRDSEMPEIDYAITKVEGGSDLKGREALHVADKELLVSSDRAFVSKAISFPKDAMFMKGSWRCKRHCPAVQMVKEKDGSYKCPICRCPTKVSSKQHARFGEHEKTRQESTYCSLSGCNKPRAGKSKYCSRNCSNKNARKRYLARKASEA